MTKQGVHKIATAATRALREHLESQGFGGLDSVGLWKRGVKSSGNKRFESAVKGLARAILPGACDVLLDPAFKGEHFSGCQFVIAKHQVGGSDEFMECQYHLPYGRERLWAN